MRNCPFNPYCKFTVDEDNLEEAILNHVIEKHQVARSTSYGDKYHGNGHLQTLEIGND